MSNAYQLIWFRQDLRIHDHAALWHASQQGPSLGLVILSPEQWKQHADAPIKIGFYLRQLRTLQKELAALHIPLVIQVIPYWKEIANFISDFSKKYNIENVYANIEIGVNELKRDKTVQDYLNRHGKELFLFQTVLFFLYVQSVTNHNNHIKYLVHSKKLVIQSSTQAVYLNVIRSLINIMKYH